MAAGRRPTPTYLKLLRGNPGKRKISKNEPQPAQPATCPEPPSFLDAYAVEEWRRVAREAFALRLLTALDLAPMAAYCSSFSRWRATVEALAQAAERDEEWHGLLVCDDKGNLKANPLVRASSLASRDMLRFASEFGFSPAARVRLQGGDMPPPGGAFAGLLAGDRDDDWPA
jgi:P27 family predicted phage terminase small subunit